MVITLLALDGAPKVPAGPFGQDRRHGQAGPSALLRRELDGSNGAQRDGRAVADQQHGAPMHQTFSTFAAPVVGA